MNFIFSWQEQYLTRSLRSLVRYCSCHSNIKFIYYMEKSVLLGTKPLVDSIRHFIRDLSGVFSVCHLCECRIVPWGHDSRLLLLLNWFLPTIKRTLHVGSKIWILCSRGKNNIEILFLPLEHKIHIFSPPCNILYMLASFFVCEYMDRDGIEV